MYSLSDYWAMMADKGRMDPYVTALQSAVNNDSVVVDIGTGTGFFALLACKLGARHVYAIEPNDAVQVGRELAKANGFSERITFIQGLSSKITLPEKANVIISDMRGMLPLCTHHLPSIIDARRRHLEHGGVLIPSRDSIRVALTEAPDLYQRYTLPYNDNDLGIDMQAAMRWVRNSLWIDKVGEEGNEQILGEAKTWVTLDYHTLDNPNVSGDLVWQIEQSSTVHGIRVWFDTVLAENVGFSNAPDQAELIYGSIFFPFLEPVSLNIGDTVSIDIHANLVGDNYIWRWDTKIFSNSNPDQIIVDFKQSSFDGMPLSLSQLKKRAANYKPDLNDDGILIIEVMKMMEQGLILEDIAHKVTKKFPERFPDWQHALARVGELSIKYSK